MFKKILLSAIICICLILSPSVVRSEIVSRPMVYQINNQAFEGYVAQNRGFGNDQPVVILIHDWNGIDRYEKMRANMLSTQGYTVLAIDLYGQGIRPQDTNQSRIESGKLYGDRSAMRQRIMAGIEQAKKLDGVNPEKIFAIGYCFGGASVLELARTGIELNGIVSFHGSLNLPEGQSYDNLATPLLILHGSADPVSPMSEVTAMVEALNETQVDFDLEIYGGVLHSFTNWNSDDYDPKADLQSWSSMLEFFSDNL